MRSYFTKGSVIFYSLLFLSLWYGGGGLEFGSNIQHGEMLKQETLGFRPFVGQVYGKFDKVDVIAAVCIVWFSLMIFKYRFLYLVRINFITKLLTFRLIYVLPLATIMALIYTDVSKQQIIRTFARELIPLTFFIFAWISFREKKVKVDELLKFIKYVLIAKATILLILMVANREWIIGLTTRKEVFNLHTALLMPLLLTICFVDFVYSKERRTISINMYGLMISILLTIFSLKRVAWAEIVAVAALLIVLKPEFILSFRRLFNPFKLLIVGFATYLIINSGIVEIYGGSMEGLKIRFLSILAFVQPSKQMRTVSEFGSTNSLTGHDLVITDTFLNILESPILGKGNQKTISQTLNLYHLSSTWGWGGGGHAGHLWYWLQEGLLGFIVYLLFYFYIGYVGYKQYKRDKSKYGLILLASIVVQFLQGITWPNLFYFVNTTIIYMFLYAVLLFVVNESNQCHKTYNYSKG